MFFWNWTGTWAGLSRLPCLLLAATGDHEPVDGCDAPARVRGMDLWVEIEEGHVAQRGRSSHSTGRAARAMLATLPEPQRAALVLRYQEDLTPEEIADTLDAPLATVKSQLQRGLKLLRAKAQSHLKDYPREG
jgi:RNA polymerase sigma-70 factor, ECF subfamily